MLDFPITDTHVHFWQPTHLRYHWLDDNPTLNKPFLPEDYRAACGPVKVDRIVFVEAGGGPEQAQAEAGWVTELAQSDPRIVGIVAMAPLEEGTVVEPLLEQLSANPLVKGIRRLLQGETESGFCLRPDFIAGVQLIPRYGFSFDICINRHQVVDTVELVKSCPEVSFVLDHIGKPDIKSGLLDPWRKEIRELAALPNVVCKISGMVTEADHAHWTPDDLRLYVEHIITCFGWDRVLYGSDWPVAILATEYPRWVETLETLVEGCSKDEKHALFAENGGRVYRLPG